MNESQRKLIELIRASVFTEASLKPQALNLKKDDSNYGSTDLRLFGSSEPLSPNPSHLSPELTKLAKKHSVLPTILPDYEAVLKSDNQLFAADEMQSYFENHGIYNCALKGINTKRRYPKPELRPMSDVDILYKPEQHKEFKSAMKALGYEFDSEGRKHDFYKRQPFIMVEAHREPFSPEFPKFYEYYKTVWDRLILKPSCKYTYEFKLEDEFIYCIAHAAEHMKLGGIGVRPVLDVAVYLDLVLSLKPQALREQKFNWEYFYGELDKLGLRTFYDKISAIAENWFLNGKNEVSAELEDFILDAGLYGTEENVNAAWVGDSKAKFISSALFPSYESMCSVYPWLRGNKALLPIAWAERGTKAIIYRKNNIKTQFGRFIKTNKSKDELGLLYKELDI